MGLLFWHKLLLYVTIGVSVLAALVFIFRTKAFSSRLKYFGYFVLVGGVFELLAFILARFEIPNLIVSYFYTPIEFLLIGLFFGEITRAFDKRFPDFLFYIGLILIVGSSFFLPTIEEYQSITRTGVQLILIFLCVFGFYLFTVKNYPYNDGALVKIIFMALLLKYSGSIFLYLFNEQIATLELRPQRAIWLINTGMYFVAHLIILIGFINTVRKPYDYNTDVTRTISNPEW
ncbi:MAG: hypothetical protein DWQ02_26800 [Bacteroidetes bacterium]|nr:MAG: hypothetical protein DWQ02_26800 [Bacteroidota bacterium]